MDSIFPSPLAAPALVAVVALVALLAWHRRVERDSARREEEAVAQREALVLEEQALRAQLHAANEALRRRAESLQRILRASSELKAHLPLDAVLANVVRAASTSLGYRRVLLSLRDRADGVLVPRAHVGLSAEWPDLERLRVPADRAAATPAGSGPPATPLASLLPATTCQQLVAAPLVAGDRFVGLLELDGPEGEGSDAVDRQALLELFATQAVTAIRLALSHETTRLGSLRDPLTGVSNHGHFQEALYRELTRHERSGEKLVLLMVDLDDFKAVNDRHGHPAGDAVLKAVVARLLSSVREMDTVARYGGEEFTVILPQTDAASGVLVAERLRAAVAASPLAVGFPEPLRLSVSIGLALFPDDASAKGALIACADQALYAAKKTGKNRVVRFARVGSPEALLTERT